KKYEPSAHEWVVDLMITDNQAMSVENALQHLDLPVKMKRSVHWEIRCDSPEVIEKIRASGVLFNDRKEKMISAQVVKKRAAHAVLVRAHEDMVGQQKLQMLKHHFGIDGVQEIRHGILWQMDGAANLINSVIHSHILFNPY